MSEPRDPVRDSLPDPVKDAFEQARITFEREAGAFHLNDVPWYQAEVPPPKHDCWEQSSATLHGRRITRCACGATMLDNDGFWMEKNQTLNHQRRHLPWWRRWFS